MHTKFQLRNRPLARERGLSLYAQIREQLRSEVMNLAAGSPISTEGELEKHFGVSRITIRKAVEDLVTEGILVRQQGKGTFVQGAKLTHELNAVTSWTEQLRILGFEAQTQDRKIREIPADEQLANDLRLAVGDACFLISRLRLANQQPVSIMLNYISTSLVPNLSKKFGESESFYDVLDQEYGLIPSLAVDKVETRLPSREEVRRLAISARTPVLCVSRTSYLADGTPLERAIVVSRGDCYQYQVSLRGRARLNEEMMNRLGSAATVSE